MAGTVRLTSTLVDTTPRPSVALASVRLNYTRPAPVVRLMSAQLNIPANVKVRLTGVRLDVEVYGTAPESYAGGDLQVAAGEKWQLQGSESTSAGTTVTARRWTLVSRIPSNAPDVPLSSPTVAAPTFVAPILWGDAQYQFAYQVTSSTGMTSTADSAIVYVSGADRAVMTPTGWAPAGRLVATASGWA